MNPASIFNTYRLKYVATLNDEALSEATAPDYELQYVDIGNVDSHGLVQDIATYKFAAAPSRARRIAQHGDVVVSTVRTYLQAIAAIENPPANLIVSTGFAVVRPKAKKIDSGFCKYALRENRFLWAVESRSTGVSYPAINASELADIQIAVPPLDEQRRVASYLDRETARIDLLVEEKQHMLNLLEEKRIAFIGHTVTRGLDANATLKSSGIEWLGDIPAHWGVIRIKFVANVGNGSTPAVDNADFWADEGFPWLNSSVVNADIVERPSRYVTDKALRECHLPVIEPPAVLIGITGQGKTRGMAAILMFAATINQHVAFLKSKNNDLSPEYLHHVLGKAYSFLRNESDGAGSTKGAITCEQIENFYIPLPPLNEQRDIVAHLKSGKRQYEMLQNELQLSANLLKERRAALITAAVTGQIPLEEIEV